MNRFEVASGLFLVLVLALMSGCGQKLPTGFPPLHPCLITIIQDGSPLSGASVILKPVQVDGMSVGGVTDAKGVAVMMAQGEYPGVPAGNYKVLVAKFTSERNPDVSDEELNSYGTNVPLELLKKSQIHTYYVSSDFSDPKKTPLEIQIVEGKNEQTFEVPKP